MVFSTSLLHRALVTAFNQVSPEFTIDGPEEAELALLDVWRGGLPDKPYWRRMTYRLQHKTLSGVYVLKRTTRLNAGIALHSERNKLVLRHLDLNPDLPATEKAETLGSVIGFIEGYAACLGLDRVVLQGVADSLVPTCLDLNYLVLAKGRIRGHYSVHKRV